MATLNNPNVPFNAPQVIETKYTNAASCEWCEQEESESLGKCEMSLGVKRAVSSTDGGNIKLDAQKLFYLETVMFLSVKTLLHFVVGDS